MNLKIENSQNFINSLYKNRRNYEDEFLDYKIKYLFTDTRDRLEVIKDIISFANTFGGCIVYGVSNKEYIWEGIDADSDDIDDICIKDVMKQYVDEDVYFKCGYYYIDSRLFYIITVEKYIGNPIAFKKDGNYEKMQKGNLKPKCSHVFLKGDIYGRVGSSSKRVNDDIFFLKKRKLDGKILTNLHDIDMPYKKYVDRPKEKNKLIESFKTRNTHHVQINGIGGIGKTSFIRNFIEEMMEQKIVFDFKINSIIWISGKMDQFDSQGNINALRPFRLSYEEVLITVADTLFINCVGKKDDEIENLIFEKLELYPSFFVFDNMETINDEKIINFISNLPTNCRVIFTTRLNMSTSYLRFDILGFESEQFEEFIKNSLEEIRPTIKDEVFNNIKPYLEDFRHYTGGSPIIMQFIIQKICSGFSIENTLKNLKQMDRSGSQYLSTIMDFCFNDSFYKLTYLQKEILFAMSISDDENEKFEIADLSFIVEASDENVQSSLVGINECSFCNYDGKKYSCPILIRAFLNKKISEQDKEFHLNKIASAYYTWISKNQYFDMKKGQYFSTIKAFNFKRKIAVSSLNELKVEYEETRDFEKLIDGIDVLIKRCSDYAYLYFEKAMLLLKNGYINETNELLRKAIELDPNNEFYLSEYGFYLLNSLRKPKEAIEYFKKALSINSNLSNVNHGIAVAYSDIYGNEGLNIDSDMILEHFKKGYVENTEKYFDKFKYIKNAQSHAQFLKRIGKYSEALEVCDLALKVIPDDVRILSLKGSVLSLLYPDRLSETKIKRNRTGLFSSLTDEQMEKLFELVEK